MSVPPPVAFKQQDQTPESKSQLSTPPTISLPKGGGAIRGIGEKFDVDLCTGTGTASIPIAISHSRGVQPDLTLKYDSGAGNGCFGLGWHLSLPHITRKTSKGVPQYRDGQHGPYSDVFLLSGQEDLVPLFKRDVAGSVVVDGAQKPILDEDTFDGYFVRRFAPRIEGFFSCIEMHMNIADPADVFWRTISSTNETAIFGSTVTSRITDPNDARKTFSWLLSERYDDKGNAMLLVYKSENSSNVSPLQPNEHHRSDVSRSANRYLKRILYGNVLPNRKAEAGEWRPFSASQLPVLTWKFSVLFDYGEHDFLDPSLDEPNLWKYRLDPFSSYTSSFEIRTYRLCQRIIIFHHFDELGAPDTVVRSYDFTYSEDPKVTCLTAVQKSGYSVQNSHTLVKKSYPPVTYEYSRFPDENELRSLPVMELDEPSQENLPIGLADAGYQWVDLDGEGLSGILTEQDGTWYYKRNISANSVVSVDSNSVENVMRHAKFAPLELISTKPSTQMSSGRALLSDISGSGTVDLVDMTSDTCGFYERAQDGSWMPFRAFDAMPNIPLDDPSMRFVDLTGDGLADILVCLDRVYHWIPSRGSGGYGEAQRATVLPYNDFGSVGTLFTNTEDSIHLADMTGDGLADLVRIRNGEVCYWPGLGYGNFGSMVVMDNVHTFDSIDQFKGSSLILADIDGTGTADIIYLTTHSANIYVNFSGNAFSTPIPLESFPSYDNFSSVAVLDILGNGTSEIVWSSKLARPGTTTFQYIDLMQGKKPYLLTKIANNLGAETLLHYTSSTQFYIEDKDNGTPWISRIPFPVQCLSSLEVIDHISSSRHVSRYRYHHGYFDGHEREFRGFGMVEEWDTQHLASTETANGGLWHSPSSYTKTWFHTGFLADEELSQHMAFQYFGFPQDSDDMQKLKQFNALLLDDTVLPNVPLNPDQERQACRAMKGHMLRKETYMDHGSNDSNVPLSVDESNFTIVSLQQGLSIEQPPIFLVHPRESLKSLYEKDSTDPRIAHTMTLQVDTFGNVLKSLQISYGRMKGKSNLPEPGKTVQETTIVDYAEIDYTKPVKSQVSYRIPIPYEQRNYELHGLVLPFTAMKWDFSFFYDNNFSTITGLVDIPFEQDVNISLKQKRLFRQVRTLYRANDLSRILPLGEMESLALPGECFSLCLTAGLLEQVFGPEPGQSASDHLLPHPAGMLDTPNIGYRQLEVGRWWRSEGTVRYHPDTTVDNFVELATARENFFTPTAFFDPFNNGTKVEYDAYKLLPIVVTDPLGNRVSSVVDYRVMAPKLLEDANGNQTAVVFDTHGLMVGSATMGKHGENLSENLDLFESDPAQDKVNEFFSNPHGPVGLDLLRNASTRVIYDVGRYFRNPGLNLPAYSCMLTRVTDPLQPLRGRMMISFNYFDGFQRTVQSKTQAESDPAVAAGLLVPVRWLGSGGTTYNERGLPTRQWEPFFDHIHDFNSDMKVGVSSIVMYDALDRPIITVKPDHTIDKTVFTNAWSRSSFDSNDNVLLSDPRLDPDVGNYFSLLAPNEFLPSWHDDCISGRLGPEAAEAARQAEVHFKTATTVHTDPLGRSILVEQDQSGGQKSTTGAIFDIAGNEISSLDAEGRLMHMTRYDLHGAPIRQAAMDAGKRWMLYDGSGTVFLSWNGRNIRCREVYDPARRHLETWLRSSLPSAEEPEKLILRNEYGEIAPQARDHNLLGKLWRVKDQSGILSTEAFDFRGNLTSTLREILQNYKGVTDLSSNPSVSGKYRSTITFDSACRPVMRSCPDNTKLFYKYNDGGQIERILANVRGEMGDDENSWQVFVSSIKHNAKGQVVEIKFGNGSSTTFEFDSRTFRLRQLRTSRSNTTNDKILQDLNYTYDAVGNITHMRDDAQQTAYFRNEVVKPSCKYKYDPLYRLIEAAGREHLGQTNGITNTPTAAEWDAGFHSRLTSPSVGNAMGNYTQNFEYSKLGSIQRVVHTGAGSQGWTRSYAYGGKSYLDTTQSSNRLTSTEIHGTTSEYTYDDLGNMTSMPHVRMQWDYKGQLSASSTQVVNNGTPETTYYVYDATGARIRKVTESMATPNTQSRVTKEQIYLGSTEVYREFSSQSSDPLLERSTLHVEMGDKRVATVETRTSGTNIGPAQLIRFQLDNNVGSSCLELDKDARIISYEEYYPYGATSYQAVRSQTETPKRYRFCMNERDEETGLNYHQARYYASWLGVWTSCDPETLLTPRSYQSQLKQSQGSPASDESAEEMGKKKEKQASRIRTLFQNLYVYAANNPVKLTDNTGRLPTIAEIAQQLEAMSTELIDRLSAESTAHGIHQVTANAALGELSGAKIIKNEATGAAFNHRQSMIQAFNSLMRGTSTPGLQGRPLVPEIYRVLNQLRGMGSEGSRVAAEGWSRIKPAVDLSNAVFEVETAYEQVEAEVIAESDVAHQELLRGAQLVRGSPMVVQLEQQGLQVLPKGVMNSASVQWLYEALAKLPATEEAAIEKVNELKSTFVGGAGAFMVAVQTAGRSALGRAGAMAGRVLLGLGAGLAVLASSTVSVMMSVMPEGSRHRILNGGGGGGVMY